MTDVCYDRPVARNLGLPEPGSLISGHQTFLLVSKASMIVGSIYRPSNKIDVNYNGIEMHPQRPGQIFNNEREATVSNCIFMLM
jgi:hypothetical protein